MCRIYTKNIKGVISRMFSYLQNRKQLKPQICVLLVAFLISFYNMPKANCTLVWLPQQMPTESVWNVKELTSKTTQYNIAYDYCEHHLSKFQHQKSVILPQFYEIMSKKYTNPSVSQDSLVTDITYETSIHLIPVFKSFLRTNSLKIPIHKQVFVQKELNNIAYYYYLSVKPPYMVSDVFLHGKILLQTNTYKVVNQQFSYHIPFYISWMRSKIDKEVEKSQKKDVEISIANFKK